MLELYNNCKSKRHLDNYFKFIESRKDRTLNEDEIEKHHILPKSLGGGDEEENLITLSPREHYIAHLILHKAVGGKMTSAYWFMSNVNKERLTSRQYEKLRKEYINSRTPEEWRRIAAKSAKTTIEKGLLKGENHPLYGIGHTEEARKRIKENHAPCDGANNSRAKKWILTSPAGELYQIYGTLRKFCLERNLSYSTLIRNRGVFIKKSGCETYIRMNTVGWKLEEKE